MMSKLGNIEAAQATELMTATLNGFKLSANDAMSVVDRLIALDNSYATSVAEIATALQYTAAVANQAGVNFNQMAAYITIVSSVMRISAESIGQSFFR
jgi:TP901 family phage tail tape measure protein